MHSDRHPRTQQELDALDHLLDRVSMAPTDQSTRGTGLAQVLASQDCWQRPKNQVLTVVRTDYPQTEPYHPDFCALFTTLPVRKRLR